MKLSDINDALGTEFTSENYDSIGGIIIETLDRFPTENEQVTTNSNIVLTAVEVIQNRIEKVKIELPEQEEAEDTTETDSSVTEVEE